MPVAEIVVFLICSAIFLLGVYLGAENERKRLARESTNRRAGEPECGGR
jgi:hypothetical protein